MIGAISRIRDNWRCCSMKGTRACLPEDTKSVGQALLQMPTAQLLFICKNWGLGASFHLFFISVFVLRAQL